MPDERGEGLMQALVTGATSGIGRAIAQALHAAGHAVVAFGREEKALAELRSLGLMTRAIDLADRAGMARALEGLAPDVLVNNAGIMPRLGPLSGLTEAEIDQAVTVNLSSVLHLTRAVVPGMQARGRGHIFFTGSTAGHAPFAGMAVYSATKAAVGGFAQGLRLDLAPYGVRVTEIVAGRVETGLYKDLLPPEARAAMYADAAAVQPEDVAAMVMAVLALPPHVDVARFDILPTRLQAAPGAPKKGM
jgi:3-hydroxy acid dehydrogenase / malonic semialdehyde reductase